MASAIDTLRKGIRARGASLSGPQLRELGTMCLGLFTDLCDRAQSSADPRIAIDFASLVEEQFRACIRAQPAAAAAAEATGAHTLELVEYDALRDGTAAYDSAPRQAGGRTCYKDTTAFLAAWLGINYFEAAGRVQDAHRLAARRTMAGTTAAPRFELLAALFRDPSRDPRPVLNAARRLEKFEPEDRIHLGSPLDPAARAADGTPLEEHAARILAGRDPVTAEKRLSDLCMDHRKTNTEAAKPEIGIFKRPSMLGVDQYLVRVEGTDAELMRSLLAQADNPATRAGAAARIPACPASQAPELPGAGPPLRVAGSCGPGSREEGPGQPTQEAASWLTGNGPPPPWAIDPAHRPAGEPATSVSPPGAVGGQVLVLAEDARVPEPSRVPVPRRRLQAMLSLLKVRSTGTGNPKVVSPEIIVYMHARYLLDLAGAHGISTHGVRIEGGELRRLLCAANITPMVLNGRGQVLDVGRTQRTFTGPIRKALLARDRGCIMPGCTVPPEHCEGHHYKNGGWAGGCGTSVEEGTLLCPLEHDDYHAGKFKIVEVDGLPHVLLPKHLDPSQTPQRNGYWFGHEGTYEQDGEGNAAGIPGTALHRGA